MLNLLKDYKLFGSLLLGVLFMFNNYTSIIGFILIFNVFDLLGFRNVLNAQFKEYDKSLASYRVMQFLFELSLLFIIFLLYGWEYSLISKSLHWFALQDIFYYIIGGYKFPDKWTWLKWTPLGIIKGDLTNKEVIIQAILGIIIGVLCVLVMKI